MTTLLIASLLIFVFTAILTVAGVGAAFIVVPTLFWLGIPLAEAMAVGLLLNVASLGLASVTYIRKGLVNFRAALPIIVVSVLLSPLGVHSAHLIERKLLLALFAGFLLFAAGMMLFYRPKSKEVITTGYKPLLNGGLVGGVAGYLGGLLGVGGGNIILPVLVGMGFDPKIASATTGFAVVFASLSGFLSHATVGSANWGLLGCSLASALAGAWLGAWLMTSRLDGAQVKKLIAVVLCLIAGKIIWGLWG